MTTRKNHRRLTLRIALASALLLASSAAVAKPEFWETFSKHYKPAPGSALATAKCVTCHVAVGNFDRNVYGKELQKLVKESPDDNLTVAMLQQVEAEDSDRDGRSNGEEIAQGALPGQPSGGMAAGAMTPAAQPAAPTIPNHSFHPLVVHFPLGIYLFGVFLEMWGRWRRSKELRVAGAFALVIGALFGVLSIGTGIFAALRLGLTDSILNVSGDMQLHLISGTLAGILMLGVAFWRRKKEQNGAGYWFLLCLSAAVLIYAGHIGAGMVWN